VLRVDRRPRDTRAAGIPKGRYTGLSERGRALPSRCGSETRHARCQYPKRPLQWPQIADGPHFFVGFFGFSQRLNICAIFLRKRTEGSNSPLRHPVWTAKKTRLTSPKTSRICRNFADFVSKRTAENGPTFQLSALIARVFSAPRFGSALSFFPLIEQNAISNRIERERHLTSGCSRDCRGRN
jgi:hypothetical protein